jgi:beta-glucosidase
VIPDVLVDDMAELVKPGDLETIRFPVDVLGVNYYSKMTVRAAPGNLLDVGWGEAPTDRFTAMGWPVLPEGLFEMLMELKTLYGNPDVIVTENGAAYEDRLEPDERVADGERIAFLRAHMAEVHRALEAGCRVKGYLVWSLLDNFEWAHGKWPRFGLIEVDYTTFERKPRKSALWYSRLVKQIRSQK